MSTLTDRYVRAVVRSLPRDQRASASSDLHGLLDAEISRRGGDADAERETLVEMGDPRRVAQEIRPHRHRIVGVDQYPSYIRVLRDSLLIVVPVVAVLGGFTQSTMASGDSGSVALSALAAAAWATVAVLVLVTLGFVVVERVVPAREWTLDDLPDEADPPRIAFADVVLEAVTVLLAFGIVCWQQVASPIETAGDEAVPVLQRELWDLWLWVLFGLLVASVLVLALAYRHGRWTAATAFANLAIDLALFALVVWLAATDRILDPAAQDAVAEHLDLERLDAVPTLVVALVAGIAVAFDAAGPLRAARR